MPRSLHATAGALAVLRGRFKALLRDPAQLAEVLDRWFKEMNALHDAYGIDGTFDEAQTRALLKAVEGWA